MLRRHAVGFRALLMVGDGAISIALLGVLSYARFSSDWLTHWSPILAEPGLFALAYSAAWVAALWLHGLYRPRARWTFRSEAVATARAAVVMALATLSLLFVFRLPDVSRAFLAFLFPLQWILTISTRAALRWLFERFRERGHNLRYVLVAGAGPSAQRFAAKLEAHRALGLRIAGFVDDDLATLPPHWKPLGSFAALESLLHEEVIDEVAICLPISAWDQTNAIARLCEEEGKIVRVPVDWLDHAFAAGRLEDLDGTPVYSLVSGPDRALGLAAKRLFDLLVATVALVALSPLFILVAMVIRASDGSPVLFRQVRVGLHGRRFEVLKFRTMVRDAEARYAEFVGEADPRAFKMTDDPRITSIGGFLRRTSLDELPQLWNVVRGEMSLVGPRPAPPREVAGYDLWHRRRLSMKPGMTGLWQVSARRLDNFDRRAEMDLSYIDRWSLLLDFKILVKTFPAALEGR